MGKFRLTFAAILVLATAAAWAAAPRIEASLGFGGHFVPDRWAPLWIRGVDAPLTARITVIRTDQDDGIIGRETFPAGAGQTIECPVPVSLELRTIAVQLLSGDRILAELKIDARANSFPGHMVLACGLPVRARLAISSALAPAEPLQAIAVGLGDLPANGLDYDGVSALAIADPGPALSPAQREALLAWVAGGGRLAVSSARPARAGLLGSFGLDALREGDPRDAPDAAVMRFGLGGIVRITRDIADVGRAEEGGYWRRILALAPYGQAPRLGPAALETTASESEADASAPFTQDQAGAAQDQPGANQAGAGVGLDAVAAGARTAMLAGLGVWLLVIAAIVIFSRPRKPSAKEADAPREPRAAPLILASLLSLAIVVASIGAIDTAFMRGSSVRALAIVMPGSGAAIVSTSLYKEAVKPSFSWLEVAARRAVSVVGISGERGMFHFKAEVSDAWAHATTQAAFSLASAGSDRVTLAAVVGPKGLAGSTVPYIPFGSFPRGGEAPPELDSTGPMAFLSETSLWWVKDAAGPWTRRDSAPSWLKPELSWVYGLRAEGKRSGAKSFLLGAGAAPGLGLGILGGPARRLFWALPLGAGPLVAGPQQTPLAGDA